MESLEDDRMCFVCGEKNPIGLHLKWDFCEKSNTLKTSFVPGKELQGWKDVVHGGILTTVLDETMANHCIFRGIYVVSVEINVRFKKPAVVDERLGFEARAWHKRGKLYEAQSSCYQNDTLIASASGKLIKIDEED
jgi:acyl-coenzyme A thioesterase PaaI-like protein